MLILRGFKYIGNLASMQKAPGQCFKVQNVLLIPKSSPDPLVLQPLQYIGFLELFQNHHILLSRGTITFMKIALDTKKSSSSGERHAVPPGFFLFWRSTLYRVHYMLNVLRHYVNV